MNVWDMESGATLVQRADAFAEYHFVAIDKRRKYTGEPYMVHPREVADIVRTVPHDEAMIAAALLHDTVEDTPVSHDEILALFGWDVADLVHWLTDVSTPEDGNRKTRKAIDRNHSARASARAQTVKLADLISNSRTITKFDPDFAVVYMREKAALLELLTLGDRKLWSIADDIVEGYFRQNPGQRPR